MRKIKVKLKESDYRKYPKRLHPIGKQIIGTVDTFAMINIKEF